MITIGFCLGDFNFYQSLENRNMPGGNIHDTFHFNEAIGHLGLLELPIKGGLILGVICSETPFQNNLTSSSPWSIGLLFTQTPLSCHCHSQNHTFSGLRTFGQIALDF
jgi:hypothetical protein